MTGDSGSSADLETLLEVPSHLRRRQQLCFPWPPTRLGPIFGMPHIYMPDFMWLYNPNVNFVFVSRPHRRPPNQARIGKQEVAPDEI